MKLNIINKFKKYIVYGVFSILTIPFFFGGCSYAEDLLLQLTKPSQQNMIHLGDNVNTVGNAVIKGSTTIGTDGIGSKNSVIIRITKLILSLTIALSITMILYNGMIYIIETGQGKEGKSLMKNVAYIVVGILVALLSVVIITLIQSIPTTIEKDLTHETGNKTDKNVLEKKAKSWKSIGEDIGDLVGKIL